MGGQSRGCLGGPGGSRLYLVVSVACMRYTQSGSECRVIFCHFQLIFCVFTCDLRASLTLFLAVCGGMTNVKRSAPAERHYLSEMKTSPDRHGRGNHGIPQYRKEEGAEGRGRTCMLLDLIRLLHRLAQSTGFS